MSKHRLESFSDGVFAIVITLLILNIHLDRQRELTLKALGELAPDIVAFVLSYVIVGVYWVSHHNMLHMIRAVDRRLLWLNLLLLLAIVFIPFPAGLLGQQIWNPIAVATYGLNLMVVNALGTAMWLYAGSQPALLVTGVSRATVNFVARVHTAPILAYAVGVLLARWYIPVSILLFAAVPAFFILPNPFLDRHLFGADGAPR
jgi:uncharacterized membrane protein